MTYVVDASVVMKWFITEPDSGKALVFRERQLSGDIDLAAPDLLLYEVAHVLVRKKGFHTLEAQDAIDCLLGVGIDIVVPDRDLVCDAIRLANESGLSVYDACYAALAAQQGAELVTSDKQLFALRNAGLRVSLLEMFQ